MAGTATAAAATTKVAFGENGANWESGEVRRRDDAGGRMRRERESPPYSAWDSWTFVEFYYSVTAVKWSRRDERDDMVESSR